jgi:hypothetical protein
MILEKILLRKPLTSVSNNFTFTSKIASNMLPRYILWITLSCYLIFIAGSLSCSTMKDRTVFKKNDCVVSPDAYFGNIEIARLKFERKEYELSYKVFKCAFGSDDHLPLRNDAIKMAAICFETVRDKEAGKFLEQSVLAGGTIEFISKSSHLEKYHSTPVFRSFRKNYPRVLKQKQNRIDTTFAKVINELLAIDMAARNDSTISFDSITNVDIRNAQVFRALIESKGLPCFGEVNYEDIAGLYGLTLHFSYQRESAEFFMIQAYRLLERRLISPELYNYLLKRSKNNHENKNIKWPGDDLLGNGAIKMTRDMSVINDSDSLILHKIKDCLGY